MSTAQVVATSVLFDYLTDASGTALSGASVHCTLNYSAGATVISPQVSIGPVQQTTTTDSNGYWQFSLVANTNINPANTTYTIQTPYTAYDVTVGASGPYQSTSVGTIVSTPVALTPATTNLTGPITVTGNETVTGTLTVQGATALQGGSTVTGGETVAGNLTLTDAASRIVPGATSLSLRNTANNADNLLISNAGAATVRAGLTVTAGGLLVTAGGATVTAGNLVVTAGDETITAGRLILGAAASKIVPGATSLSLRNTADSANNLTITDAGLTSLRNSLAIPPVAGGTVASSNYGSVQVKIDEKTPTGGDADFTSIPSGFRHLVVEYTAKTSDAGNTSVNLQANGDTGNNYGHGYIYNDSTAFTTPKSAGAWPASSAIVGACAKTSPAPDIAGGRVVILNYTASAAYREIVTQNSMQTSAVFQQLSGGGSWNNAVDAINRLRFFALVGTLIAPSKFTLYGIP